MHTRFLLLISLALMLATSASQAEPATSPGRAISRPGFSWSMNWSLYRTRCVSSAATRIDSASCPTNWTVCAVK